MRQLSELSRIEYIGCLLLTGFRFELCSKVQSSICHVAKLKIIITQKFEVHFLPGLQVRLLIQSFGFVLQRFDRLSC
jgi:hypothetical protein